MDEREVGNVTLRVENRIPGWRLHVAQLSLEPGSHEQVLGLAIRGTLAKLRRRFPQGLHGDDDAVRAIHDALGCDGCRRSGCRPTSERLAASILEGAEYERSFPAREFRDILSLRMMLPWGMMDTDKARFPLIYRLGEAGESVMDHGETVDLQGVPILTAGENILSSPCTMHDVEQLDPASDSVVMVSYTPMSVWRTIQARTYLSQLIWMSWAFKFDEERAFKPQEC